MVKVRVNALQTAGLTMTKIKAPQTADLADVDLTTTKIKALQIAGQAVVDLMMVRVKVKVRQIASQTV